MKGYVDAMVDLGLEDRIRICRASLSSPALPPSILELLGAKSRPTAAFAQSDGFAVHLFNAADKLDIAIPGDLAIAGYQFMDLFGGAPVANQRPAIRPHARHQGRAIADGAHRGA